MSFRIAVLLCSALVATPAYGDAERPQPQPVVKQVPPQIACTLAQRAKEMQDGWIDAKIRNGGSSVYDPTIERFGNIYAGYLAHCE
jgi:hypothetical protein